MQSLSDNASAKKAGRSLLAIFCCASVSISTKAIDLSPAPACGLSFEGEVSAGHSFVHAGPDRLDFLLESLSSGWIIRILPHGLPRTAYDFAGLATPPYDSPNPILISTDFAFRAQDAIGWNPRHFQYFSSTEQMRRAVASYSLLRTSRARATAQQSAAMANLIALSSSASPANFTILDAHLIGGTGDQFVMAAAVASHFSTTAHVVEQPSGPHGSPLGKITWMRFRVDFPQAHVENHRSCTKSP